MSEIGIGCDDIFIDPRDVENDNIGSNDNSNRVNTNNGRRKRQALNSTMDEYVDLTLYVSIEGVEETNSFVFQTTTGDTSTPGNQTNVHSCKLNETLYTYFVPITWYHFACVPLLNCITFCQCTDQPPTDTSGVIIGCAVGGGVVVLLVVVFAIAWVIWAAKKSVKKPVV